MVEEKSSGSGKGSDVDNNKVVAALAYVIFFLPYLAARDSKFAMYHANQGLLLLLLAIAVNILGSAIPVIGWFIILPFGGLLTFILFIMGILNALNGKEQPLPLIGKYTLLK